MGGHLPGAVDVKFEPDIYARLSANELARRFRISEDELKLALQTGQCVRYQSTHNGRGEVLYSCIAYVREWMQATYTDQAIDSESIDNSMTYRQKVNAGLISKGV